MRKRTLNSANSIEIKNKIIYAPDIYKQMNIFENNVENATNGQ